MAIKLYKHNLKTYYEIPKKLEISSNLLIVQAPSTGKSYLIMKSVEDLFVDSKILYLVPNYAIQEGIEMYKDWNFNNVEFMTYSKLFRSNVLEVLKEYDVFILDEAHHVGSPVWGKACKVLLDSSKICIGLTATNKRDCDGLDVAVLFNNNVLYGPNLTQAIESKIWSDFDYVITLTSIVRDLELAYKKIMELPECEEKEALLVEHKGLELSDLAVYEVGVLVRKYLAGRTKWLLFCSNKKELDAVDLDVCEWFEGSVEILKLDSRNSRREIKNNLHYFNNYAGKKPIILCTINILNEGLHLKGVQGLIFLRKTNSKGLAIQQYGRGFTTDKSIRPVFIDVAANINVFNAAVGSIRSKGSCSTVIDTGVKVASTPNLLNIDDTLFLNAEDFINRVNKIKIEDIWTIEELNLLKTYYPNVKGKLNKTIVAIESKAKELQLKKPSLFLPWEDAVIKKEYAVRGSSIWMKLNNKTAEQVRRRASKLGVKYKARWTQDEDMSLLRYGTVLGRTEEECSKRLRELRSKWI